MMTTEALLAELLGGVLPWLLVAAFAMAGVWYWWRMRAHLAVEQFRTMRRQRVLEEEVARLRGALAGVRTVVEQVEREGQRAPLPGTINLTRRSQVIRMSRRGENADQIAQALAIPRNEVDLVLKIHQLVVGGEERAGESTSRMR